MFLLTDAPEEHLFIIVVATVIQFISFWIAIKTWRSNRSNYQKVLATLLLCIPFIGIVFYGLAFNQPPVQPLERQNRSTRTSGLWGWGRYSSERQNLIELESRFLEENRKKKFNKQTDEQETD